MRKLLWICVGGAIYILMAFFRQWAIRKWFPPYSPDAKSVWEFEDGKVGDSRDETV